MKKAIFWIIGIIIVITIYGCVKDSNSSNNATNVSNNLAENTNNQASNTNENSTIESNEDTLESKLKKSLVSYKFESLKNENNIVTLNATKTGNAQKSIADDVMYEYIRDLAPIVYKDESVENFIFKVKMTDDNNPNFNYTYGCSLDRKKFLSYNWANVLDTKIPDIILQDGQIYSD